MITDFEDFCIWVFVVVDDIWKPITPFFNRPGPKPECGDSELIAMTLIGECRGWHMETELLSCWQEYRLYWLLGPSAWIHDIIIEAVILMGYHAVLPSSHASLGTA